MRISALFLALLAVGLAACAPQFRPAGPPSTRPVLSNALMVTPDARHLPLRVWRPNPKPLRAAVVALHGFNDYGNAFAAAAAFWAEEGIVTYAYDQRGFGAGAERGYWPGIETLVDDVRTAVGLVRERHPGLPVYLLGESMGGAVAIVAATDPNPPAVDGLILSAPAVWGRETMPFYQRVALWLGVRTAPWLKLSGRGLKITPSDNVEMLRALSRDPLVIKETRIDAIYGLVDLMDAALEAAPRLALPALVLYGERDEIIPPEPTARMVRSLPREASARQRVAIYPKGYHMLLRDLQGPVVQKDVAAWVLSGGRLTTLPSGAGRDSQRFLLAHPEGEPEPPASPIKPSVAASAPDRPAEPPR